MSHDSQSGNSWTDSPACSASRPQEGEGLCRQVKSRQGAAAKGESGSSLTVHSAELCPQTSESLASSSGSGEAWGRRLEPPCRAWGSPQAGHSAAGPALPLRRFPTDHTSQLGLENPSWRLPIPELRQNHVNSGLVSGCAVAEKPLPAKDESGAGPLPPRIPSSEYSTHPRGQPELGVRGLGSPGEQPEGLSTLILPLAPPWAPARHQERRNRVSSPCPRGPCLSPSDKPMLRSRIFCGQQQE